MTDDVAGKNRDAGRPAWPWCFAALLVVFLAQLFPPTGIFLMFLLAMFWSVILVNLGFTLMLIEALSGKTPRYLVVLPALWFGGYAVATVVSHWQASEFIREINLRNEAARVGWNPAKQDLLLAPNTRSEGPTGLSAGSALIERYGLKQVFVHQTHFRGGAEDERLIIEASACPALGLVHDDDGNTSTNSRVLDTERDGPYGLMNYHVAERLCETRGPGRPTGQTIVISVGPMVRRDGVLLDTQIEPIVFRAAAAISVAYAGRVQPITWLPTPILGCGLMDRGPSWKCFATFWHEEPAANDRRGEPIAVIATILGLTESTPMGRFPHAGWHCTGNLC